MPKHQNDFHWGMACLYLGDISSKQAKELEARLVEEPFDREARASLVGYYSNGRTKAKSSELKRIQHVFWILENEPDCDLGTTPYLRISKTDYPEEYEQAKEIVLRQCEKFKKNPTVLMDLGMFFSAEEPHLALQFLRQAHSIEEKTIKHRIAFWISQTLNHVGRSTNNIEDLREAVEFMQEAVRAKTPNEEFDYRFWLANMAFESEQFELAKQISDEILVDNPANHQCVHVARNILGILFFREKDIPAAAEQLLLSAKVKGSPRLCSYGPMMKLAQELLEFGERHTVIQYLKDCRKFWKMEQRELTKWIQEIESGGIPKLEGDTL